MQQIKILNEAIRLSTAHSVERRNGLKSLAAMALANNLDFNAKVKAAIDVSDIPAVAGLTRKTPRALLDIVPWETLFRIATLLTDPVQFSSALDLLLKAIARADHAMDGIGIHQGYSAVSYLIKLLTEKVTTMTQANATTLLNILIHRIHEAYSYATVDTVRSFFNTAKVLYKQGPTDPDNQILDVVFDAAIVALANLKKGDIVWEPKTWQDSAWSLEWDAYVKQATAGRAPTTSSTEPTVKEEASMPTISLDTSIATAIDALLAPKGLKIAQLIEASNSLIGMSETLDAMAEEREAKERELAKLRAELVSKASTGPITIEAASVSVPKGVSGTVRAQDIFKGPKGEVSPALDFEVPNFTWEHDHPDVPVVNPNYKFRLANLIPVLYGLLTNSPMWVWGHSGTGKTTLIEQVCARLGWPMKRINLDSNIERADFVGKTDLVVDEASGATKSIFTPGILPAAMEGPYVLLMDEADFGRSDIMYVVQRALEGKGLVLTEDGGRLLQPHPFFRFAATANTRGQGDEFGAYPGSRPQSAALLDRFRTWVEVGYLDQDDEEALLQAEAPATDGGIIKKLVMFASEMRKAFLGGEVMQPISPRGLIETAKMVAFLSNSMASKEAIDMAVECCITTKATTDSKAKINELALRTLG